jgi:hypothetical protein
MGITHAFTNPKTDGADTTIVRPSDWNADHIGVLLNKYDATAAPAVADDSGDGYAVGSVWIDITGDKAYICVDATEGAAVWNPFEGAGETHRQAILASVPIAYYRLSDALGASTVVDEMNTYPGAPVGAPTFGSAPLVYGDEATSMTCNGLTSGAGSGFSMPNMPALATWSFGWWMLGGATTSYGYNAILATHEDSFNVCQGVSIAHPRLGWYDGNWNPLVGDSGVADGELVRLMWTYNGATLRVYRNGRLISSGSGGRAITGPGDTGWTFGCWPDRSQANSGKFQDFAIWDRVVTAEEEAHFWETGARR